jgi:hypothetical protein
MDHRECTYEDIAEAFEYDSEERFGGRGKTG